MKTPPLLLGAALIYWGFHSGYYLIAALAALVLEGSRLVSWRWELSRTDLRRIVILCNLLIGGGLIYFISGAGQGRFIDAVMSFLQFLPLALLPLIAARMYSAEEGIDAGLLFLFAQKKTPAETAPPRRTVKLTYPYFAVCLIAAGAGNARTAWFYAGFSFLVAWVLWTMRPRNVSLLLWTMLYAIVFATGYAGHVGLHQLQGTVENAVISWYVGSREGDADPLQSRMRIGRIGSLKLSDRIVLRLKTGGRTDPPPLLHQASYTTYVEGTWFAGSSSWSDLRPDPDGSTWKLRDPKGATFSLNIAGAFPGGKGVLPLPQGPVRIENLPAAGIRRSVLGTVTVEEGPAFADYRIEYNPAALAPDPPSEADLRIPKKMTHYLTRISREIGISSVSSQKALQSLALYLSANFRYSAFQESGRSAADPLEDFLVKTRSGHCEYFAAATVLLLRTAGIPARYATGYAVREYSDFENAHVVRSRHAHAWARVYSEGGWRDFDTTPPDWYKAEEQATSWFRPVSDLWSWAGFQFAQWRGKKSSGEIRKYALWVLAPAVIIFAIHLFFTKRVSPVGKKQRLMAAPARQGGDSEFYALESKLTVLGFQRRPWEPLSSWIQRIGKDQRLAATVDGLQTILALHYQYRFDPQGIDADKRKTLNNMVENICDIISRPRR